MIQYPWSKAKNALPWPDLDLENINRENLKLVMELSEKALETQVAGFRIQLDRCGKILAQSVTLATALIGAAGFFLSKNLHSHPGIAIAIAAVFCIASAIASSFSMLPVRLTERGIRPFDIYQQDKLNESDKQMYAWVIENTGNSLSYNDRLVKGLSAKLFLSAMLLSLSPPAGIIAYFVLRTDFMGVMSLVNLI